ncbi:MAG: hypothetical protein HC938_09375 [Nitrospira sp.]|nr:hypothetical protein [Nitrospira sp.]
MDIKAIVMFVAGVTLFLFVIGIGAWIMTAPLEAGEVETKRCNEYVVELDQVKKYNWFLDALSPGVWRSTTVSPGK